MNNVQLSGRLTRDPELRSTASGIYVCSFTLAVDKRMSKERRNIAEQVGNPTADFIQCQAWSHMAEHINTYGYKGGRVQISQGHINTRSYDDSSGRKIYVTEVIADQLEIIDWKQDRPRADNDPPAPVTSASRDYYSHELAQTENDDLPF